MAQSPTIFTGVHSTFSSANTQPKTPPLDGSLSLGHNDELLLIKVKPLFISDLALLHALHQW